MNLKKFLKEGYVLSPYYYFSYKHGCDFSNCPLIKKQISEKELASLARHYTDKIIKSLDSEGQIVFFASSARYHIRPEDVLTRLEETLQEYFLDSRESLIDWVDFLSTETGDGHYFYPYYKAGIDKKYIDDYLFKNGDHIVTFVFSLIKTDDTYGDFRDKLISYITFIKETTAKKERI